MSLIKCPICGNIISSEIKCPFCEDKYLFGLDYDILKEEYSEENWLKILRIRDEAKSKEEGIKAIQDIPVSYIKNEKYFTFDDNNIVGFSFDRKIDSSTVIYIPERCERLKTIEEIRYYYDYKDDRHEYTCFHPIFKNIVCKSIILNNKLKYIDKFAIVDSIIDYLYISSNLISFMFNNGRYDYSKISKNNCKEMIFEDEITFFKITSKWNTETISDIDKYTIKKYNDDFLTNGQLYINPMVKEIKCSILEKIFGINSFIISGETMVIQEIYNRARYVTIYLSEDRVNDFVSATENSILIVGKEAYMAYKKHFKDYYDNDHYGEQCLISEINNLKKIKRCIKDINYHSNSIVFYPNLSNSIVFYLKDSLLKELDINGDDYDENTFNRCTSLQKLKIKSMEKRLNFEYCENLKEVEIIGKVPVFYACESLEKIDLKNAHGIIFEESFGYTSIDEIIIPNTISSIQDYAFYDCEKLTNIILNEGLLSIGDEVFSGCNSLQLLALPNSLTKVSPRTFENTCIKIIELNLEKITTPIALNLESIEKVFIKNTFSTSFSLTTFKLYNGKGNYTYPEYGFYLDSNKEICNLSSLFDKAYSSQSKLQSKDMEVNVASKMFFVKFENYMSKEDIDAIKKDLNITLYFKDDIIKL